MIVTTNLLGRDQIRLMALIWVRIRSVNKHHNLGIPLQKRVVWKVISVLKQFLIWVEKFSLIRKLKFWKKDLILHVFKRFWIKDFEEFSRRMRCTWHFRNEVSENFCEAPSFIPKSVWKPPKGHASLEVLLSRLGKELFLNKINEPTQSNLSGEEWKTLRL